MKKELQTSDKSHSATRLLKLFYIPLAAVVIMDLFIHKHAEFPWEAAPAFSAAFGFSACVLLVFVAKILRSLIKRDENYYD